MNKNLQLHSSGKMEYLKSLKEQYEKKIAEIKKSELPPKKKAEEIKIAATNYRQKVNNARFNLFSS